jgi:hypothetical protein
MGAVGWRLEARSEVMLKIRVWEIEARRFGRGLCVRGLEGRGLVVVGRLGVIVQLEGG